MSGGISECFPECRACPNTLAQRVHIFPSDEPRDDIGTEFQLELGAADPTIVGWIQIGLWMNYEMDHAQRLIPARWSDQNGFTLKHVKVHPHVVESLPIGSGMVMSSSSKLQLAAITPICSRPGGVVNLGNGANDIIRAYSSGGRAHDLAGTHDIRFRQVGQLLDDTNDARTAQLDNRTSQRGMIR